MNPNELRKLLGDSSRRHTLAQCIRAKIPPSDVEDIVQSTLADALAAPQPPGEVEAFDRWLFGIARHKIADYYRRGRRHEALDDAVLTYDDAGGKSPESARDLLRWVNDELPQEPETSRTLEWMMREASGDNLETIANENQISAPAVRQRVSRLRRFLRERWAIQAAAALGLLAVLAGLYTYQQSKTKPTITPDLVKAEPSPVEQAQYLRQTALSACQAGRFQQCVTDLDRARAIDPVGDTGNDVRQARAAAAQALTPKLPSPIPTTAPKPPTPKPPTKVNQHTKTYSSRKSIKVQDESLLQDFEQNQKSKK